MVEVGGMNVKIRSNVRYESERTGLTGAREHPKAREHMIQSPPLDPFDLGKENGRAQFGPFKSLFKENKND
jgi:hypothetical protein